MKIKCNTESGSIRTIIFLGVISVGLLWKGGQDLYTALLNRTPTAMSYDEYVKSKPNATWLTLTNCYLDLVESTYKSFGGGTAPIELHIPVRSTNAAQGQIQVLLATKDPGLMATFNEMQGLKSKSEFIAWAMKNRQRVHAHKNVTGLVRFGIDSKQEERDKVANLHKNIASDFIMLEDGAKPNLNSGLGFAGLGAMILVGMVLFVRSNRAPTADEI